MMGPSRATDYLYCEVRARLLHAFAEIAPQFRPPPPTEQERRFQAAGIRVRPTQERPPHQLGQDIWVWDILFSLCLFIRFVWYDRESAFSVQLAWSSDGRYPKDLPVRDWLTRDAGLPQGRVLLQPPSAATGATKKWVLGPSAVRERPPAGDEPDGTGHAAQYPPIALPSTDRLEDALLCADAVVAQVAQSLLEEGLPFLRGIATACGAVWLPEPLASRGMVRRPEKPLTTSWSRRVQAIRTGAEPYSVLSSGIPSVIFASSMAIHPGTRAVLRDRARRQHWPSLWKSDRPKWCRVSGPRRVLGLTAGLAIVLALSLALIAKGATVAATAGGRLGPAERGHGMVGFVAVVVACAALGAAAWFTEPARRCREVEKRRFRSNEEFVRALGQAANHPADVAIAVRRAFARAYDLPVESIWVDECPRLGLDPGPGRIQPLLHEFAVYLAESLPSVHDPRVLGDRMAGRETRADIRDLVEAARDALT